MSIDQEDEDLLCYKSKLTTDSIVKSNNHESVGDTKKTIMKNNTTTKGLKNKKEELSDIRNVKQVFQDFQNDSRSSSIRTPKRLLFKFKKRKDHDPNNNKIKTEEVKSTYKKKHKKKFKWIGSSKLPIGDESHQFKTFKLDLSKIKNEQDDSSDSNMSRTKSFGNDHFPHPSIKRMENDLVIAEVKSMNENMESDLQEIGENAPKNKSKDVWRIITIKDN